MILTLEKTTARALERKRLEKPARKKPATTMKEGAPAAPSERSASRRNVERFLLLYTPSHPATWIVHVLFYFGLLILAVAPIMMAQMGEPGGAVAIAVAYLGILAVLRAIAAAVELGATTNAFRRWSLLYKAPRKGTTVFHVVFFLMLLITGAITASLPPMIASQTSDLAKLMFVDVAVVLIVLTFTIREIAAARDPLRPAGRERSWFARLFYIWRPRRAAVWLPRLVWYVSAFLLLLLGPQFLADSDGNLRLAAVAENGGEISHAALLLAVAISARGWVLSLEIPRLRALDLTSGNRVRQFLPLSVPSKAIGWVPMAMSWISTALAVAILVRRDLVLPLLGLPDANAYYIAGLAAVIAVGASRWARVFLRVDGLVEKPAGAASA